MTCYRICYNDPVGSSPNARGLSGLTRYGITSFGDAFSPRQQMAIATICHQVRAVRLATNGNPWKDEISDLLALAIDHVANRNSTLCHWDMGGETISSTFQRYALRVNWDFVEGNPAAGGSGSFISAVDSIALTVSLISKALDRTNGWR